MQVAQTSLLASAKRSLTEESVDYDNEYEAKAASPTGSQSVPTSPVTEVTSNGTVITTQSTYSTNATVPAVKMAATLSAYATVADFNTAIQARVCAVKDVMIVAIMPFGQLLTDSVLAAVHHRSGSQHSRKLECCLQRKSLLEEVLFNETMQVINVTCSSGNH